MDDYLVRYCTFVRFALAFFSTQFLLSELTTVLQYLNNSQPRSNESDESQPFISIHLDWIAMCLCACVCYVQCICLFGVAWWWCQLCITVKETDTVDAMYAGNAVTHEPMFWRKTFVTAFRDKKATAKAIFKVNYPRNETEFNFKNNISFFFPFVRFVAFVVVVFLRWSFTRSRMFFHPFAAFLSNFVFVSTLPHLASPPPERKHSKILNVVRYYLFRCGFSSGRFPSVLSRPVSFFEIARRQKTKQERSSEEIISRIKKIAKILAPKTSTENVIEMAEQKLKKKMKEKPRGRTRRVDQTGKTINFSLAVDWLLNISHLK